MEREVGGTYKDGDIERHTGRESEGREMENINMTRWFRRHYFKLRSRAEPKLCQ